MKWVKLAIQILSSLSGLIAAGNLGRLTGAEADGGPGTLAAWVGLPALLSAAGAVGQRFVSGAVGDTAKPGSPGHAEFCQSVYQLALACEWDRLQAAVKAWQATNPDGMRVAKAWQPNPEPKP